MILVSNYVKTFKDYCINHPELQHDDEVGRRVFLVKSLFDYFAGAWREKLQEKKYVFVLMLPNSSAIGNNYQNNNCGFSVLHFHSERSGEIDKIEAMNRAQKVGISIIKRMVKDAINGAEIYENSFFSTEDLGLTIEPDEDAGDTGYSGFQFWFEFKTKIDKCDTATAWADETAVIGDPDTDEIIGDGTNIIGA